MITDYEYNNRRGIGEDFKDVINNIKIGICISEWYPDITKRMFDGVMNIFNEVGISHEQLVVEYVPGSYELPFSSKILIEKYNLDGVICLGCVIRGETSHYDLICNAISNKIIDVSLITNKPVIFGVLTTENINQAMERAGGKLGNKGEDSAWALIKMINIIKR